MHAVELIAAALPEQELPDTPAPGVCCVTGQHTDTIPRKHGIKPTFTNLDLLRAPGSDRIGLHAWRALTEPAERQSSWICDGQEFHKLIRTEVRALVLDGVSAPIWCGYATTSYKKHGALNAPVNTGGAQRWLFEMVVADCTDRAQVQEYWQRMRSAQDAGIHRPVIEALDAGPWLIGKVGARVWCEFEAWARPRMHSPLYQFIAYLLPSKEEMKSDNGGPTAQSNPQTDLFGRTA